MHKLDKKDKDILFELDLDSRQSFNQIAKKVRLSKEVVQYRIKLLETEGIIKGYQTIIDVSKLGYLTCRFFIKFQQNTPEGEEKIIKYYKNHSKFWWVASIGGFIDLGIGCRVKDTYELFQIKEDLVNRFGKYISELSIAIYDKFYVYNRKYFSNKKEICFEKMFSAEKSTFDEKDIAILNLIGGNARMNLVEISAKTKISVTNVNYRINKLIENKIITGFKLLLDLGKIGYYWYKVEMQLTDISIKSQMLNYFKTHPNIIYAYETLSDSDIEFELEVSNFEQFRSILDEIRKIFGKSIKKDHYFVWYKEHKFIFTP